MYNDEFFLNNKNRKEFQKSNLGLQKILVVLITQTNIQSTAIKLM